MIAGRTLHIIILLLSVCYSVSALEVKMLATKAGNVYDQFSGLLPARTPAIPETGRVYPLHRFRIYFPVSKIQTMKGKAHVIATLKLKDPEGKISAVFENQNLIYDDAIIPASVHLANLVLTWEFKSGDPEGVYTFMLDAEDKNNQKRFSGKLDIELIKKQPVPLEITTSGIRGFISGYYKAPQPERLLELFNIFLAGDAAARKQKGYSPLPLLYGMAQALKDNPGLHREFARLSHTLETDHKKYLTLLFAAMGKEELISVKNYLDRETAGYFKKAIENNPWQFSEPYLKDEINAFWMEFFFTGKKEPLLKIANQLQNRPTMTAKQAKEKKGALSPFEERKLKNFFSASQAAWSIRENASKHNLVFFYLEAMLENGEFADPTAALKIQKILLQTASAAANK